MARFFIDAAMLVAQLLYADQATFCLGALRTAGHSQAEQLAPQLGERHREGTNT